MLEAATEDCVGASPP